MGAILVAGISMLIYMRQRKTTEEQDKILKHIENWEYNKDNYKLYTTLEENHERMLENHNKILNNFSTLNKKIDSLCI
jgi:arginyl-tRNA--protein-N-Asp/Glu arginylyltransferase